MFWGIRQKLSRFLLKNGRRIVRPRIKIFGVGCATLGFASYQLYSSQFVHAADQYSQLMGELESVYGKEKLILSQQDTKPYVKGIRLGQGEALAVIKPQTLQEAKTALEICTRYNVAILPQGQNTGLTGGSVPRSLDRPFVIISLAGLKKIIPIGENAEKVICFAGLFKIHSFFHFSNYF